MKNFVMYGSEAIYHIANWRMDQVTNRAMGKNIIEYWSILKLRGILKFVINFHSQWDTVLSRPEYMKMVAGIRLVKKAVLMVRVMLDGEFLRFVDSAGSSMGVKMIVSVSSMEVFRSNVVSITFTWICTKMSGS